MKWEDTMIFSPHIDIRRDAGRLSGGTSRDAIATIRELYAVLLP